MSETYIRMLVVTMYAGEAEFDRCVAAVRAQDGVVIDHEIIRDLSNVEAHRRLYETIQSRSGDFDLAVKIDADMVLATASSLRKLGRWFLDQPELDHAQVALHDFYTDRVMMGMQVYSPRVRWNLLDDEALFVDPSPEIPGVRVNEWNPPFEVPLHSPDPGPVQAFRFGVHRAQKALQRGRTPIRGSRAHTQWLILVHTWEAYDRTRDPRRGLAISGADLVMRGVITEAEYHSGTIERIGSDTISESADPFPSLRTRWKPGLRRALWHLRCIGLVAVPRLVGASLRAQIGSSK